MTRYLNDMNGEKEKKRKRRFFFKVSKSRNKSVSAAILGPKICLSDVMNRRPEGAAKVSNSSRADLFLLFLGEERTALAASAN